MTRFKDKQPLLALASMDKGMFGTYKEISSQPKTWFAAAKG
jgi:hypothetical protein